MPDQSARADAFRTLHVPGRPLVLYNVWDVGSARAVAGSGAPALATGSWSVAAAQGYPDGERMPLDFALSILQRICATVDLPVSADLEAGYDDVARTVARAIEAGAIGCNLEDSLPATGAMRPVAEAAARLAAARAAADAGCVRAFLNARTDVFFQAPAPAHDEAMADEAIERARAYADAGADGIFVPGLADERLIARITAASPLPVNIQGGPGLPPPARQAELGVARVSWGHRSYLATMQAVEEAARAAL